MKTWSTPVQYEKSCLIPCCICGGLDFKPNLNCAGFSYVQCRSCSLVQMNPQPIIDEIIARYSQKYGEDYLSYEIENEGAFLKLQQLTLKDAGFDEYEKSLMIENPAPSVLDIGCATGSLLACLRERGWQAAGVEISPSAGYAQRERSLEIHTRPLEEIGFPGESFNAVLASHLIEHLNDPRSFLNEVNRILKPEGRIFITTPNISGLQAYLYKGRWRSAIFDHLYLFSIRTLTMLIESTGFKAEKVSTWGGLGAGLAPAWIKKPADFFAKRLGFGDVMIIRAKKI